MQLFSYESKVGNSDRFEPCSSAFKTRTGAEKAAARWKAGIEAENTLCEIRVVELVPFGTGRKAVVLN